MSPLARLRTVLVILALNRTIRQVDEIPMPRITWGWLSMGESNSVMLKHLIADQLLKMTLLSTEL